MQVVGSAHGQVILNGDLNTVSSYFADHKKILSFNPLCKHVSNTELENVYRWDFEVTDPRSHPITLIFFIEQAEQSISKTDQKSGAQIIGNQILWTDYPIEIVGSMPDDHTFIGSASGSMEIKRVEESRTFVDVRMKVAVDFNIPKLLTVFPESILKLMTETVMSMGMNRVSQKMLEKISKDFSYSFISNNSHSETTLN